MASFGSTKCARNSVSRAKSCDACVVGGEKWHVFWEKLRVFARKFLAGFPREECRISREK